MRSCNIIWALPTFKWQGMMQLSSIWSFVRSLIQPIYTHTTTSPSSTTCTSFILKLSISALRRNTAIQTSTIYVSVIGHLLSTKKGRWQWPFRRSNRPLFMIQMMQIIGLFGVLLWGRSAITYPPNTNSKEPSNSSQTMKLPNLRTIFCKQLWQLTIRLTLIKCQKFAKCGLSEMDKHLRFIASIACVMSFKSKSAPFFDEKQWK